LNFPAAAAGELKTSSRRRRQAKKILKSRAAAAEELLDPSRRRRQAKKI
jgi:hypothetical protein